MGVLREMAEKLGHKVLPLAPYSPELNPIEKVWANIKRYLRTVLSDYARFDDALLSYFDFNLLYFGLHSTPKNNFHIFQKVILILKICY